MIFSNKSVRCMYEVLYMLGRRNENYASLYREAKVSHETLQNVLKYLLDKKLIVKEDKGHKKSYYSVSKKGKDYFWLLVELDNI